MTLTCTPTHPMRAAAYVRVSTKDQVDEGLSLDAQLRAIRSLCAANGWDAVEYVEAGVSASKEGADRPQFRKLLEDVDHGRVQVVVVHKLDRFSRQLLVTMQSLRRISKAGAGFVSLSEHIDMSTPAGRLMLGMLALLAEFYSDNLATEVSKGRAERAQQGLWNGDLPFGYRSTGDAHQPPCVVPEEAKLVLDAFKLYASGTVSSHEVASWLNQQGVSPRSKRGLTRFTKATVIDMLSNPFYTGNLRYRGGKLLVGRREAIVNDALFDMVSGVRTSRRRLGPAVRMRHARVYLLRGLARCASCGTVLWCSPSSRGDRYRDSSKLKQRECSAHRSTVAVKDIDEQVEQLVRGLVLPDSWREDVEHYATEDPGELVTQSRRRALKDRLSRLREVYLDGDLRRGQYEIEGVAYIFAETRRRLQGWAGVGLPSRKVAT